MDGWLETLQALPYSIYLKWTMLLIPAGMLLYWQLNSQKAFRPYLDQPSAEIQKALFDMGNLRGWIILTLWMMLSITLITYDLRFPERGQEIQEPAPTITQDVPPVTSSSPGTTPAVQESYLNLLKSRYEDAFLTFFYLRRCKAAQDEDYQALYLNFKQQLVAAGADTAMIENTVSAALGSFETIYSGSPCDPKYLNPMQERFRQLLDSMQTPGAP